MAANDGALPFEPLAPNAETIAAMKAARRGGLPAFDSVDAPMNDLHADDGAARAVQAGL